jgi:hypothetical protein
VSNGLLSLASRWTATEPDAGWATVCFSGARGPEGFRDGFRDGLGDGLGDRFRVRPVSVRWRSDVAHGSAIVRLDALAAAAEGAYPSPCLHPPGLLPCDVHLWADPDSPHRPDLAEYADVLVSRVPLPLAAARRRVGELLARHPGCLAVAVRASGTGCVVIGGGGGGGVRDGAGGLRYARSGPGAAWVRGSPLLVASVVHAWVAAGRSPGALRSVAAVSSGR